MDLLEFSRVMKGPEINSDVAREILSEVMDEVTYILRWEGDTSGSHRHRSVYGVLR